MTRKHAAAQLASPAIAAVREVYRSGGSDAQRIAALIEIAGAAAALARTVRRYRPVDTAELAGLVSRREDVAAVLGRGQWLPTQTFHVPAAARVTTRRRTVPVVLARPAASVDVPLPLFAAGGRR